MSPVERFQILHVQPKPGRTLVIGSKVYKGREDRRKLFPDAVGLDMLEGDGVDIVHNLEQPLGQQFDHIDCVSVLEHCPKPWVVAENIMSAMVPRGTIFVSVPFVFKRHGYPNDYFRFTADGVRAIFPGINWSRVMQGHYHLCEIERLPIRKINEYPMIPRTEIFAFGQLA